MILTEPTTDSGIDTKALCETRPLHIAVVDEELPYPMTSGKRIRTLNLLQRLAGRHRISFLSHRNPDPREAEEAAAHLKSIGIEPIVVDRTTPPKTVKGGGVGFYSRLAINLFSSLPYLVSVNYSPALERAIRSFEAENEVDLWQCEWTPYAEVLRGLPAERTLIMAHNVESLIWQRYFENESSPAKRWYIKHQWRKLESFEKAVFARAVRTVLVSPPDAQLARDRFEARNVSVVDNGVDIEFFTPPLPENSERGRDPAHLLFLGSLDWRPNLDAVQQLLEEIMPLIRAKAPEAHLAIVGRNPPDWVRKDCQNAPGVELHSDVPDVRPFLHQCGIMVVPLRIGGGSRLKILESLAAGLPVVSTTVGAEGLQLRPGEHFLEANGPEMFASSVIEGINNYSHLMDTAKAGREIVLQQYNWDFLADRLEQVWLDSVFNNPIPRLTAVK